MSANARRQSLTKCDVRNDMKECTTAEAVSMDGLQAGGGGGYEREQPACECLCAAAAGARELRCERCDSCRKPMPVSYTALMHHACMCVTLNWMSCASVDWCGCSTSDLRRVGSCGGQHSCETRHAYTPPIPWQPRPMTCPCLRLPLPTTRPAVNLPVRP